MTTGVKYVAYGDVSGYALAALAYIRALHNAGVPVQPFFTAPQSSSGRPGEASGGLPLGRAIEGDANFADVPALMRATARPIAYDTIVSHTHPEYWRSLAEAGRRLVGYNVWETDALPESWPALLNGADRILVPSQFNVELCARCGVTKPVHIIPHIRRNAWSPSAARDGVALRERLGIPADHFVFYTIAQWTPRKALPELIGLFAREFSAEDRVTLLVKTSSAVIHADAERERGPSSAREAAQRIVAAAESAAGRRSAQVMVMSADEMSGAAIDAIHAAGDAYVSLAHGEAWGLSAFDAATLGKPVIVTGWGGALDYLGRDYPGLVRYAMAPVEPHALYRSGQRWARADVAHGAQLMRVALARDAAMLDAAAAVCETITRRYAEEVVAQQFITAIDG
jgi:glycosyltransferase involved in cell wall biosynthesis